jgi:hypothetical protein
MLKVNFRCTLTIIRMRDGFLTVNLIRFDIGKVKKNSCFRLDIDVTFKKVAAASPEKRFY